MGIGAKEAGNGEADLLILCVHNICLAFAARTFEAKHVSSKGEHSYYTGDPFAAIGASVSNSYFFIA